MRDLQAATYCIDIGFCVDCHKWVAYSLIVGSYIRSLIGNPKTNITAMKRIFSNNIILITIASFILLAGLTQSLILKDFIWFSRCGSLIVAIGIILLSRTFITGKDLLLTVFGADVPENINGPEYYKKRNEVIPDYIEEDIISRKAIGWYGPLVSSVGTLIWGYGDLLNNFIK